MAVGAGRVSRPNGMQRTRIQQPFIFYRLVRAADAERYVAGRCDYPMNRLVHHRSRLLIIGFLFCVSLSAACMFLK
jgi:hypothetical protein